MSLTNKEKETSVRDLLSEAIDRTSAASRTSEPFATVHINLLTAARDRIDELEQEVDSLEMDIFDNGPY